jgi:formiminotetrahydrofolate cyclodeaminase
MLAGRIAYLADAVAVADFPPTDQHREVQKVLEQRLRQYRQELNDLLQKDVNEFNRTLDERHLPRLVTGKESESSSGGDHRR